MPDRLTFAECDNCGLRGQYTLAKNKKVLPDGWVTLSGTIVGLAIFHGDDCRDAWTSSREWRRSEDTIALQELAKISEAPHPGD